MVSRITIGSPKSQKIVVTSAPKNRVSINNIGSISGAGAQTLRQLRDVDASHLANGETLVYDEQTDKFIVETLPALDGGEF